MGVQHYATPQCSRFTAIAQDKSIASTAANWAINNKLRQHPTACFQQIAFSLSLQQIQLGGLQLGANIELHWTKMSNLEG